VDFQQRAAEIERKRQQRIQRDQDEQTDAVLAQANDIAENVVNSADIRLDQLLQTGATAGQVVTWNNVTGEWEPADASSLTDPTTTEGDVIYRDGSGLQRLGIGTAGQRLTVNGAETAPEWADDPAFRNIILNPNGAIAQRLDDPTSATTIDDTDYGFDRWKVLSELANSVDVIRISGTTQRYTVRLRQENTTPQQIGTAQYIEGANCQHLQSKEVTLSGFLRCDNNVTVKVVVAEWYGTEDVMPNDPISSWGPTVTLDPTFLIAGTEKSISLTANTWQDFSHTVTLGSIFSNLCILFYTTTGIAQLTTLDYEAIKLSEGDFTTPFEPRPIGMELALCQRYYEEIGGEENFQSFGVGWVNNSTSVRVLVPFITTKRTTPTMSLSAASDFSIIEIGLTTADSSAFLTPTPINAVLQLGATGASFTSGNSAAARANNTLDARVIADAEL
jgi:hypothetical protein